MYYYIQPNYFSNFRCIGGECEVSCCDGWCVHWLPNEIDKLKTISEEIFQQKIKESFRYDDNQKIYQTCLLRILKVDDSGATRIEEPCPFHNDNTGLCDIQKKYGEEYLGFVCKTYPRKYFAFQNQILRWCCFSCPEVANILMSDENAVVLETRIAHDYKSLHPKSVEFDNKDISRKYPVVNYRLMLISFFSDLFCSKERTIDTSLILGGLAAKHLSDAVEKGRYDNIPKIMKELKPQLNDPKTAQSLAEIKPNYQLKFKLVNNMIERFMGNSAIVSALHDGNELVVERYLEGMENFSKAFENRPFALKNLIINTFYDLYMPIGKVDRPLFENYAYFVLCAAVLITAAAAVGYRNINIAEDYKIVAAQINRSLSHNADRKNILMNEMKSIGLITPAHLALIIK